MKTIKKISTIVADTICATQEVSKDVIAKNIKLAIEEHAKAQGDKLYAACLWNSLLKKFVLTANILTCEYTLDVEQDDSRIAITILRTDYTIETK